MADSVREAIESANRGFMQAFLNRDATAVAGGYTDDAQLMPPHSDVVAGTGGIEGFWNAVMGMGIDGVSLETHEVFAHGDTAYEFGRYKLSVKGETVDHGKYSVMWRNVSGRWKLHRDIWNTSVAAPS